MTDLTELLLDSETTFSKKNIHPNPKMFALRALSQDHDVFLAIIQLRSENLLIGRKSPRSGDFFKDIFGTRIEKFKKKH